MTLSELRKKLDEIITNADQPNVPVIVCDFTDDSDECFTFRTLKDVSIVQIGKKEIVALYFDK